MTRDGLASPVLPKEFSLVVLLLDVPVHVTRGRHLVRLGLLPLPGAGTHHLSIHIVGELQTGKLLTLRPRFTGLPH